MGPGLYLHVPFCSALCPYCDFAVVVGRAEAHARYCDALVDEARAAEVPGPFETVFVGGGTPTLIDAGLLAGTLDRLRDVSGWSDGTEVTVEANPETVDASSLRTLGDAGVNRVSIGAQSFRDHVLRALGRTHDAAAIPRAVDAAHAAGIGNVSLDLIYGGPGEADDDWRGSLEAAVALEPDHVSCYALTIEERTVFGSAVARGRMDAPSEDVLADRYEAARDALGAAGFEHYELSNWARPGRRCAHNLVYWTQGDYLGLGLGAHSHRAGRRWWNTRSLARYLAGERRDGEERIGERARGDEWLTLRLRLVEGVDLDEARARTGRDLWAQAGALARDGLVDLDGPRLVLTPRGMLLENEVALRLLG